MSSFKKKKKKILIIFIIFIIVLVSTWFLFFGNKKVKEEGIINDEADSINNNNLNDNLSIEKEQKQEQEQEQEELTNLKDESNLTEPIAEFETRIIKKPFGIYITPQNSPVQPEKFQGYHTGSDIEYEDVDSEVEVFSIANGKVALSRWVSGYGGVIIISHNIEGENILSLYGHLDPNSLINIDSEVKKGDKVGILGKGGTNETDGERKHLHFGIIRGSEINLKGYVATEAELNGWYDPVEFLNKY